MAQFSLGRKEPQDFEHVDKYPLRTAQPQTVGAVEEFLRLPYQYRPRYDQGEEGACVGFAGSWRQSIKNRRYYDAFWLYNEAKKVDGWVGEDYDGTSVRAGFDILREVGHKRLHDPRHTHGVDMEEGVSANRWAYTIDEIRTAIAGGEPVVMGTNWYEAFFYPEKRGYQDFWVPEINLGRIAGGHAWTIYAASDRRQAFKMVNSWGKEYPLTWFPYTLIERLLNEYGEAAVATDR